MASSAVEQSAFNRLVIGSNPMPPTSFDARYNQLVDGQPHTLSGAGSSPALATSFAYVAQLVEYGFHTPLVASSNLAICTSLKLCRKDG